MEKYGAGNEARTRDLNLGKVALYQLSYSRSERGGIVCCPPDKSSQTRHSAALSVGQALFRYMIIDVRVSTAAITVSATPVS